MQVDAGIILTGSKSEAEALGRQFPGLTFEHRFTVEKPIAGKDYTLLVTKQSPDDWKLNAKASWGQNLYLLGARTVRHYWPSDIPAILENWHESGLTAEELAKRLLAAPVIEFKKPRPIQAIKPHDGSGLKYLASEPAPAEWALQGSLPLRSLGVIVVSP